jgi:hypothetical protein
MIFRLLLDQPEEKINLKKMNFLDESCRIYVYKGYKSENQLIILITKK